MALRTSNERAELKESDVNSRSLLERAREAATSAYAPYSHFAVGAAVETTDGEIFVGANMENASYGTTMCAEVGALQAASVAGRLGDIVRIAIVGGTMEPTPAASGGPITPCGRCRQLIFESAQLSGRDIDVLCSNLDLTNVANLKISALLPKAFGPADLGITTKWREASVSFQKRMREQAH